MRGRRLLKDKLFVRVPVTAEVWDADLGRYTTTTTLQRVYSFKGSYQPVLRIEPPIDSDFVRDRRGILRGRVYAPNDDQLLALLANEEARIEVAPTNEIVTPILKPKGQGGTGNRLRIDTGDWL